MIADILIVDDETDIRIQIAGILEDEGFSTRQAINSSEALAAVAARQPSLVILDVWLNNSNYDGMQILEIIKRDHPTLQVIMISGHGTLDMAVNATKTGAYDFISKPFKTDVLLHTINRALREAKLKRENNQLRKRIDDGVEERIVGKSSLIQEKLKIIEKTSLTDSRVFITGASGSGKSLSARIIHNLSARHNKEFTILNCATLSPDSFEKALFGVESNKKFPRKIGLLEESHGGTLLLDEIADMPIKTQAKIVRILHHQRFKRVGGNTWVEVDVRVIATSNRNIKQLINDNLFREDLYYRLNVVPIEMPDLCQHREDIPELSMYFMQKLSNNKGRVAIDFYDEAMTMLQGYHWPGNMWELINVIERLLLLPVDVKEKKINADDISKALGVVASDTSNDAIKQPIREARESFEREYLIFHLTRFNGNISRTAEFIGMDRAALHRKLKSLNIQNTVK